MNVQLMMIFVLVVAIILFIFLMVTDKKDDKKKKKHVVNKSILATPLPVGKKKEKKIELINLKKFIEFDNVVDDMIVQNNPQKFTMGIQCKGINYDLMSDIEQINVEKAFIEMISSLDFPIQLYVESRTIDIRENIEAYKKKISEYEYKCQEAELEYQRLMQSMQVDNQKIEQAQLNVQKANNIYQYVLDITNYIDKASYNKKMLQRKFYILFSIGEKDFENAGNIKVNQRKDYAYSKLFKRACGIVESLEKCQVTSSVLSSRNLIEILFNNIAFDEERKIQVMQTIDSGFYDLYSSSRQDLLRKNEELYVEYRQERDYKEQQKKTFQRQKGIQSDEINEDEEREEKVSKLAVKIISNADIDLETKDALSKLVIKQHLDNCREKGYPIDADVKKSIATAATQILNQNDNSDLLNDSSILS